MDTELVGIRVEKERRRRGLTQEQLARSAGVSRRSIWRIERGECDRMGLGAVSDVLEVLGMGLGLTRSPGTPGAGDGYPSPCRVVDEWGDLRGAASGSVELPVDVYWQGAGPASFDVADDAQCAKCYRALLTDGTRRQIAASVNPTRLVELWPRLRLPAAVRDAWLAAHGPELRGEASRA